MRVNLATITDQSIPPTVYSSQRPYGGFSTILHRFARYEKLISEDIMSSTGELQLHSLDLTNDPITQALQRPGLEALENQRVLLTPRQETKLELARLGAAVEKLSKGRMNEQDAHLAQSKLDLTSFNNNHSSKTNNHRHHHHENFNTHHYVSNSEIEKSKFVSELLQRMDNRYTRQDAIFQSHDLPSAATAIESLSTATVPITEKTSTSLNLSNSHQSFNDVLLPRREKDSEETSMLSTQSTLVTKESIDLSDDVEALLEKMFASRERMNDQRVTLKPKKRLNLVNNFI